MSNPPINPSSSESGPEDNNRYLTIYGDVHYTPNELSELKKLADDHPELAARIVSNRSQEVLLSHRTERLGMLLAVAFGLVLISGDYATSCLDFFNHEVVITATDLRSGTRCPLDDGDPLTNEVRSLGVGWLGCPVRVGYPDADRSASGTV